MTAIPVEAEPAAVAVFDHQLIEVHLRSV